MRPQMNWRAGAVAGVGAGLATLVAQGLAAGRVPELLASGAGAYAGALLGLRLFPRPHGQASSQAPFPADSGGMGRPDDAKP